MKIDCQGISLIKLIILCAGIPILLVSCSANTEKANMSKANNTLADTIREPGPPSVPRRHTTEAFLSKESLHAFVRTSKSNITGRGHGIPFDTLHYNKVIAYEFEGSEEPYPDVLYENGEFVPVVTKQIVLSPEDVSGLTTLLTSSSTYGGVSAACFNPHLGIVFYKDTIAVMQVNICLSCNYLIASQLIPASESVKSKEGDFSLEGFSKKGRAGLEKLCDKYGYWYEKGSPHDE